MDNGFRKKRFGLVPTLFGDSQVINSISDLGGS
jgi:hypothetical protein